MRIKKSKRAELEAQHAEAAELRAQHERWVQYCEDVRTGKVRPRPTPGKLRAMMAVAALGSFR
jgi:hypothetical protein